MINKKVVISEDKIIAPIVKTESLITGDTEVKKISQIVTDEEDAIPACSALAPFLQQMQTEVETRITQFENETILNYVHPATHPASMITETTNRLWFTPAERTKLLSIAPGANNYIHPTTHSASMITETSTLVWFTQTERDKLSTIEANANNYSHPLKHPISILDNFLVDGFIRPELIKDLSVQRINVRNTVLTGFDSVSYGGDIGDNLPSVVIEDIGTNQWVLRVVPVNANYPLIATVSNGFSNSIGNVDSLIICDTTISTPALNSYGFAESTRIWVMLKKDKTLYITNIEPTFDYINMVGNPLEELAIFTATVGPNNSFENVTALIPGRYYSYSTDYIVYDVPPLVFKNRLLTDEVIVQVLIQKVDETTWTVLDNYAEGVNKYKVGLIVDKYNFTLNTTNYITDKYPMARFKINCFRAY